jgi:lipopolysaccharide transport system ATP-binding protein
MTEIAIRVQDLSKKYRLFNSARDRLKEALHPFSKHYHREFWALTGINFVVPRGQTVGILGRNGSGKSTLLQIIAGVMQPTGGEVTAFGRVAALLELGAGFNPEFTGRENVIFQAQVMGMSAKDIKRKLPEIEQFADVGDFFDQPVKIYSSGMFVRVAFAAATSVDPDILIIDEALAVGDARFQQKCYERLRQFKTAGKTILFVSHSVDAVAALCDRAIVLEEHKIFADGLPKDVIDAYLRLILPRADNLGGIGAAKVEVTSQLSRGSIDLDSFFDPRETSDQCHLRRFYNDKEVRQVAGGATIIDFRISRPATRQEMNISSGENISLYIKVHFHQTVSAPLVGIMLKTVNGISIYGTNTFMAGTPLVPALEGDTRIYLFELAMPLKGGAYFIDMGIAEVDGSPGGRVFDVRRSVIHLPLVSRQDYSFSGLVDLSASISEVPLVNVT